MTNALYIVWSDTNNLGIPIIDEQHRGIISAINSLYFSMRNGDDPQIVASTLIMLEQYTTIHFKTEQSLMEQAGYPSFKEHSEYHAKLAEKTKKLSFEAKRAVDSNSVLRFLKDWWLIHINKEDRKYIPFFLPSTGNETTK